MKYILKIAKYLLGLFLIITLAFVFYTYIYANFHILEKGMVYRSAQLNILNTSYYLKKYKIKTVLNLRGEALTSKWYIDEKKAIEKNGAKLISYDMNSGQYFDFKRTSQIIQILKDAPKPLLIHCIGGADRTSLVSALYLYGVLNKSKEEAWEQMNWYYGHLPYFRPHVLAMDKSLSNYIKHKEANND